MKIDLNEILYAVSYALDATEIEYFDKLDWASKVEIDNRVVGKHYLYNVNIGHSKRVAALSVITGRALGLSENELIDLAAFAILHDNALTEFNQEELEYKKYNKGISYSADDFFIRHCIIGEKNTGLLPFRTNNRDVILYHHENADGSGPFGRSATRTPIKSQIIHLADYIDTYCNLVITSKFNYDEICQFVKENTGTFFSMEVSCAFLNAFKPRTLHNLSAGNIDKFLRSMSKHFQDNYTTQEIRNMGALFARIVDYKSHYTCRHCLGVADKAYIMAMHYDFPEEKAARYYLAGALHDIGKLLVPKEILEKPSKLTDAEYEAMKTHAFGTYKTLAELKNMKDICNWASHHHEKLNGSGYPFGLNAQQLTLEERLMSCVDIYQALTEKRPYKEGFSHDETIRIMKDIAYKGDIDLDIVFEMNKIFRDFEPYEEVKLSNTEVLRSAF